MHWGGRTGVLAIAGAALALGHRHVRRVAPYAPVLDLVDLPLPAGCWGLNGLKIAFIADIHAGPFISPADLERGLNLLAPHHPHLLLLGGDYVSESARFIPPVADLLGGFASDIELGALAVLGNHDIAVSTEKSVRNLERDGIRVLRNEGVTIRWKDCDLGIAGIDDTLVGQPDVERAFATIAAQIPILALWHEPEFAEQCAERGAFAQLSGHTHGGQVILPFIGAPWLPADGHRYVRGLSRAGAMCVYTTRGLGVYRPPFRFRCPPEVTLITLVSSDCDG
jgi:predicted MPP superfamily phosphohydrolase